jgi:PIN domain nuclease of toxin-antitoxin system
VSPGFHPFIEICFDRLLIAQSLVEPLTLLTNDALLDRYRVGARVV